MTRDEPLGCSMPRLSVACMLVMLGVACIRATCSHDPFPGWSGDPFEVVNPMLGITPRVGLVLDTLMLLAAGGILVKQPPRPLHSICLAAATASVVFHALSPSAERLDDAMLGFTWLSGIAAAIALMACCRRPDLRALAMGALASIVPLLAFKGLHQYLVEHRETLAAFMADKDRFLAAQGWSPGSAMALGYERRISQAEATGWFGLANVYASFAAASLVLGVGTLLPAFSRPDGVWKRAGAVLLTLMGAGMLGSSGAKGGFAAALLGIGVLGVAAFSRARPTSTATRLRLSTLLAVACVIGPLSLVVLRGAIGTAWGELSILFRWFYLQGATLIIGDTWLLGTGPAGFRDAYMLAKPPLAPEDVASPHSVFFDYAAMLGLGGIAAGALAFASILGAARTCLLPAPGVVGPDTPLRTHVRLAVVPLVVAVMVGAMLEQAIQTPSMTVLRIMALGCGLLMAFTMLTVARHSMALLGAAFAAAALTLAAHAQIEMTMVTPGSLPWIFCILGVAASASELEERTAARPSWASRLPVAAPIVGSLSIATWLAPKVFAWESHLRRAYDHATVVAEFQTRLAAMERSMATREDSPSRLVNDLAAELGAPVAASPEGVVAGMTTLRHRKATASLEELEAASRRWPDHFATARVFGRLLLAEGLAAGASSDLTRRAVDVTRRAARGAGTSVSWSWHATCLLAVDPEGNRAEAIESLRAAAALAPREPSHAARLARLLQAVDRIEASTWAARALEIDENRRLDPLLRMQEADLAAMRAIAANP
jgi:hypothetical protein